MKARHAMLAIAAALLALASSAQAVDMHGYFRDGVGGNSKGGDQVALKNAGQDYTLRLGNESNWGEFAFDQLMLKDKNGVEWTAEFMLGWGDGWNNGSEAITVELKQQWLKGTFPQLGGASVWGGKRYYHRLDNGIFDYFYVNESGGGAGIEDLDVGFGKLAVAVFRHLRTEIDPAGAATWMPDVRLEGMPVNPNGTLTVGVLAKMLTWNEEVLGDKPDDAASFSPFLFARHSQSGILNGGNNLAVIYKGGCFLDCHKDSRAIIVSDDLLLQPTQQFSVVIAGVFKNQKNGIADVTNNSYAIGVRPIFKVTDHFALQGDAGYFYNKDDTDGAESNTMFKIGFAPTIMPFTDGFAWGVRPEIRFYVNYASWNEEQQASQSALFGDDQSGLTFGTYVETWF